MSQAADGGKKQRTGELSSTEEREHDDPEVPPSSSTRLSKRALSNSGNVVASLVQYSESESGDHEPSDADAAEDGGKNQRPRMMQAPPPAPTTTPTPPYAEVVWSYAANFRGGCGCRGWRVPGCLARR